MTHEDNRTLQDKIAERLFNIDGKRQQGGDLRPWGSTGNELQHRYLTMAQEVVRLMEWNISEQLKACHRPNGVYVLGAPDMPAGVPLKFTAPVKPTLPPNDWLP